MQTTVIEQYNNLCKKVPLSESGGPHGETFDDYKPLSPHSAYDRPQKHYCPGIPTILLKDVKTTDKGVQSSPSTGRDQTDPHGVGLPNLANKIQEGQLNSNFR